MTTVELSLLNPHMEPSFEVLSPLIHGKEFGKLGLHINAKSSYGLQSGIGVGQLIA